MKEALKLKEIVFQASKQNDCRIYDIYKHRDRLQIFIDKNSEDKGISLKDCENVFNSLRFLLQSELPHVLESHRLEVSSPGIKKRLREKWHFEESIGKLLKLISFSPIKAQNTKTGSYFYSQSFTAHLTSVSEDSLLLEKEFLKYSIPFSKIKSAQLVFNTLLNKKTSSPFNNKKHKKRGK